MSQSPATIGRFRVINRIGRGGMGSLYLAWDPVLERQIAIKLLREDMEELRERFDREARSVARLRHPNIVTIFDVGEQDGQPFIAMEYIHGQTLAEIIRADFQPTVSRKLKIIDELCDGLSFAHKMSIIHRDVKPANVMVEDEGAVKILDFGIARIAESGMTMAGMLIGTLNYMSPEQIAGRVVDNRSDIFAIGAVMYELLAQRQAFPGGLHNGIINRILYEHPPALETLCPTLDDEVIEIVRRALEKDSQVRYQDLAAMRRDLQRVRQRIDTSTGETVIVNPDPSNETVAVDRPPERRSSQAGRRGTPPEALARLRATQLAALLEGAQRALDAEEFESAISSAEHALLLDPDSPTAAEIIDRARSALDEHSVQELVKRAGELIEAGSLTEALGLCDQALTIAPGSPAAVELRSTLDRLRLEREREHQRREAIRAAMDRARGALEEGRFEEALAAADELLEAVPESETGRGLRRDAEDAIARARQAAVDRRAEQTTNEARRAFEAGDHGRALEMLTTFEGAHPHVDETLEALTREKARLEREAERARRRRVDEAIAAAQAEVSHEAAIDHLREALTFDPARADVADLLAGRQHALEVEREEARQAREREERIADGLSRAGADSSHEAAIAILESLIPIGPDRQDLREALEARRAALERRREEMRRAEELRRKVDALLGDAKRIPDHEAALALLKEAHALDAGRGDVGEALKSREAALQKEREERRRAEERQARIAAAAQQADATGSDEEALRILKAAIARDPDAQLQSRVEQRQAALHRKQEEARKEQERQARIALEQRQREEWERRERQERERRERERQEKIASAIRDATHAQNAETAIAILGTALALAPEHEELRQLMAAAEARRARELEEARQLRERQARVASLLDQVRGAASHERAIELLREVLQLEPEHREAQSQLQRRQSALEEERVAAKRQADIDAARRSIAQAIAAREFDRADGLLKDAEQTLSAGKLLKAERTELKQARAAAAREAAEQAAREQAAKEQAAKEHAARERAAREQAAREQAEREQAAREQAAREQAAREQAAREQAAREQAAKEQAAKEQAAREQAARERAAKEQAAKEQAARERAAKEQAAREQAAKERAAKEQAAKEQAARERAAKEQAAKEQAAREWAVAQQAAQHPTAPAPAASPTGASLRSPAIAGLVAALALLVVVGYFAVRAWRNSGVTEPPAQAPVTQGPPSGATPQTAPPSAAPAEPPRTAGAPSATPPSTAPPEAPPANVPADSKVAADVKSAQDSLQQGQLQRAADAITRGLKVEPRNQALRDLARAVAGRARQTATDARARATAQGDAAAGSTAFREAQNRQVEAGRRERADQYDRAVRLYDEAARLYGDAARTAPPTRAELPPPPAADTTKPTVTAPPPAPPPPQPAAPSSTAAGTGTTAAPPATGGTTATPPVAPSALPATPAKPTPTPAPQQPTVASEEAAIRATLREYAAAYQKLDVEAVQRVYPGVNEAGLRRSFGGMSSMQVQIVGEEQITIEGSTAVVRCQVRQSFRPKVGQGRTETVASVFRLQKAGSRWIIVERR